jgi:ubiquinone biosynthesis protein
MIREAFKDLARLRQISVIVSRHGFGELIARSRLRERIGGQGSEAAPPDAEAKRKSTARRFRELLTDLGPTFIKLGQVLSTRADLIPAELLAELVLLQDSALPLSEAEVRTQIQQGLGRQPEELFASIETTPLASASIAQVHRARTKEGEDVVVKVQRPAIREQIETDLDLLYYLARLLESVIEEVGLYTPSAIVQEFDKAIHDELNFENEALNIAAFDEKYRDRPQWVIPTVHSALSSRTVITMTFIEGVKITDVVDQAQRKALAKQVVEACFMQLFSDGLFHGDPHPGNLLVLADGRIGLIDFGLVGRVTPAMKQALVSLTLAIALRDPDTVARLLYRIGIPDQRSDLASFRDEIGQLLDRFRAQKLDEIDAGAVLPELLDLAVRYRIRVPREYALLSRAAVSTEGILRQLDPQMDIPSVALPLVRQTLFSRFSGGSLEGGVLRALLRVQEFTEDVPVQLSQVLLDLQGGKFVANIQGQALDDLTAAVRRLSVVFMTGILGASLVVGAFLSLSRQPWSYHGIPILGALGFALAAMLFGAVGSWYFVSVRLKKISIRRWITRDRDPP